MCGWYLLNAISKIQTAYSFLSSKYTLGYKSFVILPKAESMSCPGMKTISTEPDTQMHEQTIEWSNK